MTSSAVSAFPSWKVTPGRTRTTQLVASGDGDSSSARIRTRCASGPNPISGSFSWKMRAKSTVVIADCASRLSALEPPVSATRKVPPFLTWGAELIGFGAEDPPHAAMPSPGAAKAPAAARAFSTVRLSISMLARAGSPLSGGFNLALIGTSLVWRGRRAGRLGKKARRDSEYEAGGTLRREIAVRYPLRHVPPVV